MSYFAAILRIILVVIGIRIAYLSDFAFGTIEFCTGVSIVIIGVYFAIIAQFGIEAVGCPMCKKGVCHIKK